MKLAIISHTEHYKNAAGEIVGWGPTISEINHLAKDFESIVHLAFLHNKETPPSALPYTESNIRFKALPVSGGKGLGSKLGILTKMPATLKLINETLKEVDAFQFRAPVGMGVYIIPYLSMFSNKKGWFKYAGNWNQQQPPFGYRLQRFFLKNQQRKVTINGAWPKQPKQCLTFENPCLTEEERALGKAIITNKNYSKPIQFCFVGRLEDAKGVQRILDATEKIIQETAFQEFEVNLVGDGPKREFYEKQVKQKKLPINFKGFLNREHVFEIYKNSHAILLPSDSEGFPKVIAEAMNFACIPIVSDVSSIGQYISPTNGYLLNPINATSLQHSMMQICTTSPEDLKRKACQGYELTAKFTFSYYRKRIQEILA